MKKLIVLFVLILTPVIGFAFNPDVFNGEATTTCNTSGTVYTLPHSGYLDIFAHSKIYFNLDPAGVTPNTSSKFLTAGGSTETKQYLYKGQKIGLLADSGTATVNVTFTDEMARVR